MDLNPGIAMRERTVFPCSCWKYYFLGLRASMIESDAVEVLGEDVVEIKENLIMSTSTGF